MFYGPSSLRGSSPQCPVCHRGNDGRDFELVAQGVDELVFERCRRRLSFNETKHGCVQRWQIIMNPGSPPLALEISGQLLHRFPLVVREDESSNTRQLCPMSTIEFVRVE